MNDRDRRREDSEKIIFWTIAILACFLFWIKVVPWLFVTIFFNLLGFG